ncbi:MAG TPA: TadE/TadG family type IV pilus assembly protein [Acetobacteraceae bacterium]|nr:TadE/TadG family type IV pilus assembly protein [Acetobacteraceae bacterium]
MLVSKPRRLLFLGRRIRRDERGVTAIEFAIIGPILIGMFISIVDLGLGLYSQVQLANAAQAGASYAMQKGYDASAMTTVAQAATRLTGIAVTTSQFCGCPSSTGVTVIACTSNCSDGLAAGTFAQVNATKDYSTLLSYPGLPSTFHLSETATARTQ